MKLKKKIIGIIVAIFIIGISLYIFLPTNDYMKMTFSEKLNHGYSSSILINGDSIGGSVADGEWCTMLANLIKEETDGSVSVNNISKPGNTSFAGIVSWELMNDTERNLSDLVILCYGQNDVEDDSFIINYEALIRNTIAENPNAEIIAILESSQKKYTNKIKSIIKLCNYYDIPYVDTLKAFDESGYSYEELSDDGIHPNSIGKEIYANAVYDVIENKFLKKQNFWDFKGERPKNRKALNPESEKYSTCYYVSAEQMSRSGNEFSTTISNCSIIGLDMIYIDGDHNIQIFVPNDNRGYDVGYSWDYDFEQRHIYSVLSGDYKEGEIKISFKEEKTAEKFLGLVYFK